MDASGATFFFAGEDLPSDPENTYEGLHRIDAAGSELWQIDLAATGAADESVVDASVGASGSVWVLREHHLVQLTATGDVAWIREIPLGTPLRVFATADGGALVVGSARLEFDVGGGPERVAVLAQDNAFFARYDAQGTVLWTTSLRFIPAAMALTEDDGLVGLAVRGSVVRYSRFGGVAIVGAATDESECDGAGHGRGDMSRQAHG